MTNGSVMPYIRSNGETCQESQPAQAGFRALGDEIIEPLSQAQVEHLVQRYLDLRTGGALVEQWVGAREFRPSSDKASLEVMGTIAQRLDEARRHFERLQDISVVERVLVLERYELDCSGAKVCAERAGNSCLARELRGDETATGNLVMRLRLSAAFRGSMLLLKFTLAKACSEDWRMREMLARYRRGA